MTKTEQQLKEDIENLSKKDRKALARKLRKEGYDAKFLQRIFGIPRRTLYNWIRGYKPEPEEPEIEEEEPEEEYTYIERALAQFLEGYLGVERITFDNVSEVKETFKNLTKKSRNAISKYGLRKQIDIYRAKLGEQCRYTGIFEKEIDENKRKLLQKGIDCIRKIDKIRFSDPPGDKKTQFDKEPWIAV